MENDKQHLGANLLSVAVFVEIGIILLNYTLPSVARFKRITFITLDTCTHFKVAEQRASIDAVCEEWKQASSVDHLCKFLFISVGC